MKIYVRLMEHECYVSSAATADVVWADEIEPEQYEGTYRTELIDVPRSIAARLLSDDVTEMFSDGYDAYYAIKDYLPSRAKEGAL